MSHFYFDSSALVKRYLRETGSAWVRSLASPSAGHTIVVAAITRVEVAAAFAARHRMPGGISRTQRDSE
ncbi:MAG: type II toxin-antitoxin system VapC family toxin [Chloroflexi bacterium]|nr:type II toxin-antitoxin system VapC family toxin [Chloroflexota bacterium]